MAYDTLLPDPNGADTAATIVEKKEVICRGDRRPEKTKKHPRRERRDAK